MGNPNKSGSFATWREGQYLNEIWGFTTIGIARSQEEMDQQLASLPNGGQSALASSWYEGDIMYKDLNNDGKISEGNTIHDTGDISLIGDRTPRFKYGLNLDAKWRGFDVRLFIQGVGKRDWAFSDNHIIYWGNLLTVTSLPKGIDPETLVSMITVGRLLTPYPVHYQ